ncbi:MAG: response regulator [SAR324 cluster bacterium]|nr:response regulator [SAR324 cluster bacterium]
MAKVLYVDHELTRVIQLKNILAFDYNIEIAFTGWEGLGAAMLYHPDIMLLNLNVDVMDGLELLRLMRTEEDLINLPVFCFSAPRDRQMEQVAVKRTCSAVFEYPFDRSALVEMIESALPISQLPETKTLPSKS